jgi:catechol 2,3-dioxygenase-like lactoylglutathione lyase family enzyme
VQENNGQSQFGRAIPILRITSAEDAFDYYIGVLGFQIDWEHRFEPGMPLYLQVSRSGAVLHLSEHAGDGTPGAAVWIAVDDVGEVRAEFLERLTQDGSIGELDKDAPGGPTFEAVDPFDNVLRFAQAAKD